MSDSPTPSFIAPYPADLAPLFPGYDIEGLIATGGMGAVYQAVQKSLERSVAIKILPHEFSSDAAFCEGFEAEAKAMARLNHPNLIGVYDFGEVAGMLYIIMEFVPGKSLFHSAHGMAIDPAEVIRIVTGICNGLAHAHDNGIIHRDIKPSNILLDLNANPKIGDFGLARPADRQIQEGEEIFGTPHYTAPEVVGAPHSVDHRADIFSVGVILHELLTGRLPAEDHRSASAISHCDPRFDSIIRRATDPLPDHRYASAHELAWELHAIATTPGPKVLRTAPPQTHLPTGRANGKSGRTAKKSSGFSLFALLLLAAVLAFFAYKRQAAKVLHPVEQPPGEASDTPVETPPAISEASAPAVPAESPPEESFPGHPPGVSAPAPVPEIVSAPEPSPGPQATEGISPSQPLFDVPAFLNRARGIMRERAAPIIRAHDLDLAKNADAYGRALNRAARKITHKSTREHAEESVDEFIKECAADGHRIPLQQDARLTGFPSLAESHDEFLEKQEQLEKTLQSGLSALSASYILGIEKQIERLRPQNDTAAIRLLEEEIELVRQDGEYFAELMLSRGGPSANR